MGHGVGQGHNKEFIVGGRRLVKCNLKTSRLFFFFPKLQLKKDDFYETIIPFRKKLAKVVGVNPKSQENYYINPSTTLNPKLVGVGYMNTL